MKKKFLFLCLSVLFVILLSGCAQQNSISVNTPPAKPEVNDSVTKSDVDLAKDTLEAYFNALQSGDYATAVKYYGGSYETLADMNPAIKADAYAELLKSACTVNGYQCLTVGSIDFLSQQDDTGFQFIVVFIDTDTKVFEYKGEKSFVYTVYKIDGNMKVSSLPVYVE